jgi:hypothetical protein
MLWVLQSAAVLAVRPAWLRSVSSKRGRVAAAAAAAEVIEWCWFVFVVPLQRLWT